MKKTVFFTPLTLSVFESLQAKTKAPSDDDAYFLERVYEFDAL